MQWSKVLLFVYLGLLISYVRGESQTGIVTGDAPDAVVNFINKTDSSYSMHAQPGDGWIFTEDFSWSGPNGWYSDTKYSIACERLPLVETVFVDASLCFSASMNGKMYKTGGQGGSAIPWSVSSALHVSPQPYIYPAESVFAKGEPQPLRYVVDSAMTNAPGGLWKYSGATVGGESVQTNWQNMGASYTLPTSLDAGLYSVYAARNTNGAFQAFSAVTLVGVKQVSATFGETTITSMTESPGDAETLYIPKGTSVSSITITAIPEPGSSWPAEYPAWKLNGNTAGMAGSNSYHFEANDSGVYTIAVTCGNSTKALKIVVIEIDSLTKEKRYIARKLSSNFLNLATNATDAIETITVKTKPAGFEDKVELFLSSKIGNITQDTDNPAKWVYEAPAEAKSDIDVEEVEQLTINSKILKEDSSASVNINICSVFHYYGALNHNREIAWKYAKWKYDISTSNLKEITYDPGQTTAGNTNHLYQTMTLGTGAFSEEWSCASIIGHENVHGGQPLLLSKPAKEQEASMWELDHSNAPNCKASPITYIYNYCKYYYDDTKNYYKSHGGTINYP